jgi:hypothetical protein
VTKVLALLVMLSVVVSAQETGARYLIITHDDFYNDILPLAQWKHKKGMRTKVVKLSQTGASTSQIKNYITNAYNTWQIRPEYLLLVGAPNYLAFPIVGSWYSDNYYTNITGDLYNEILSGRLTVHSITETQTVVNKILAYERIPNRTDSLWFKKACLIVNRDYDNDDSIYFSDAYHAAALMVANGFIEIDTLCDQYGHNASTVINRVNSGRSIVMYRGQGFNNWSYPFNVSPDAADNGTKLPIVLSITCRTLGTSSSPATAERWFLTGTPDYLKGAAGYFAGTTSGSNIAHLRSAIAKGFHDSLFLGSVKTFGAACEGGRIKAYTMYPYSGGADEYRGYTTIGDPEMNIWTDTPCSLVVTHPAMVPTGVNSFTVNVSDPNSVLPMAGAIVCVMGKEDTLIYVVDTTDAGGNAFFQIDPHFFGDTIYVTVTGRNLLPYEGFMTTAQSGILVNYYTSAVDDTLGGNGDNNINPGEEIDLHLWVKNYGTDTAFGVSGVLGTEDPYIMITDSVRSFGNMASGQVCSTGTDGYVFSVPLGIPDGYVIDFQLACRDVNDSVWLSQFSKTVNAADLVFYDALVSGGNGNDRLDPGETAGLAVSLHNQGSAVVDSIDATLYALSEFITVLDASGYFPGIGPGSIGTNSADSFVVSVDSSTVPGVTVDFQLVLNAPWYVDTLIFSMTVGTGIEETDAGRPGFESLFRVYPNPCHDALHIETGGPDMNVFIYDVGGMLVREYRLTSSSRSVTWTGDDRAGHQLPGGIYFVKLQTSNSASTRKVIFLR